MGSLALANIKVAYQNNPNEGISMLMEVLLQKPKEKQAGVLDNAKAWIKQKGIETLATPEEQADYKWYQNNKSTVDSMKNYAPMIQGVMNSAPAQWMKNNPTAALGLGAGALGLGGGLMFNGATGNNGMMTPLMMALLMGGGAALGRYGYNQGWGGKDPNGMYNQVFSGDMLKNWMTPKSNTPATTAPAAATPVAAAPAPQPQGPQVAMQTNNFKAPQPTNTMASLQQKPYPSLGTV
jgi:hypothetical protein